MTFREISRHLQISTSTAHRIYRKFEETGDVSPVRCNRCPDHRKLDEHEFLLITIVMENPCLHLHEMCSQIFHTTGVQVSGSTVCRVLQRNGFTRKKIKIVAKQITELWSLFYGRNFAIFTTSLGLG